jgi:hypothetical protein
MYRTIIAGCNGRERGRGAGCSSCRADAEHADALLARLVVTAR